MARTKQTARYSTAMAVPRRQIRKANPRKGSRSRSPSEESHRSAEINTQQFSVKFDNQKECESKAIPFKVIECPKCGAFLNSLSVIIEKEARKSRQRNMDDAEKQLYKAHLAKEWECEFCMSINSLPENFQNLPQENQCYLLEPSEQRQAQEESEKQNLLLYCIDISGSMDQQFSGKSRLEAVKEAIIDELKRMKFEKEKTKIGVITFGSLVTLRTEKDNQNIPAQHYNNFEAIVDYSKSLDNFTFSLNTGFKDLKDYVASLQTYGSTALGPGLLAAIQLTSTGRKGSKIILCTDGEANVGLDGTAFYTRAAEYAKQKGVVVNILSLKGDRCNLKELGKLTHSTGGSILKIDPKLLGSQFNKISKEEVLGSESVLKIIVNQIFEIENGVGQISKDKTTLTQDYGSFTAETELTFNFKVLSKEEAEAKKVNYDLFMGKKAPMQVQLAYTTPSGAKYVQVITDYRLLSQNKEDLYKEMNFGLFAASKLQKVSGLIKEEKFEEAEDEVKSYDRVVEQVFSKKQSKAQLEKFNSRIRKLAQILNSKKDKKNNVQPKGRISAVKAKKATKTKTVKKSNKMKTRNRGGQSDLMEEEAESASEMSQMSSDSQEAYLYKQMRARSHSRSRSRSND